MHDSKHKVTDAPFKVAVEAGKTNSWCACGNTNF